jgi:hypothetical protein
MVTETPIDTERSQVPSSAVRPESRATAFELALRVTPWRLPLPAGLEEWQIVGRAAGADEDSQR